MCECAPPLFVLPLKSGRSLIEFMVAIALPGFGMFSLMGLQGYSVTASKNAANRGIATMLAAFMGVKDVDQYTYLWWRKRPEREQAVSVDVAAAALAMIGAKRHG